LVAVKHAWISTLPAEGNARVRCRTIRRVNELLQPAVEPQRGKIQAKLERVERRAAAARVLRGREFAFCLHSGRRLRDFLDQTLPLSESACSNGNC